MDDRETDSVVLERLEYEELLIKAFLYDVLKKEAPKTHQLSDVEMALYKAWEGWRL